MNRNEWERYFNAVRKQDWRSARTVLEAVLRKEKDNPRVFLKLGDLYRRTDDSVNAIAQYYHSARLLRLQGFRKQTIAVYKIILDLDPYSREALYGCKDLMIELEEENRSAVAGEAHFEESAAGAEVRNHTEEAGSASEESFQAIPDFFSCMPGEEFAKLIHEAALHSFSAGEKIIEEGDSGDSVFLVKSGQARSVARLFGKEIELSILHQGDVFGEIAFLTGRPRTATVIADGRLAAYEIGRSALEETIEKNPEILAKIEDLQRSRAEDTIRRAIPTFRDLNEL